MVNLIQDLRKDLNAPEMKAVVATVGFGMFIHFNMATYRSTTIPWL